MKDLTKGKPSTLILAFALPPFCMMHVRQHFVHSVIQLHHW